VIQLVFETTVPEEVVVVKSQKRRTALRKKTIELDGDSDEEAQQLIDEVENEQANEASTLACNPAGPDFQKILSQNYDKILVKITLRHS